MMTLIAAAALGAAQPAPMPPADHSMRTKHEQHEAMNGHCCCCDGMKGHDMHAPEERPHEHNGE
jgi:hypothetical protein